MALMTKAPQPTRTRPLRKPPTQATANRRALWFLLLPSLIPVVLFSVYPLLNGIWLGFTDAQAGFQVAYRFNGLDNYVRLLQDDVFWNSFKIGLVWAFSVTTLQFLLALGLALLLNAGLRFQWLVRPLALVPWGLGRRDLPRAGPGLAPAEPGALDRGAPGRARSAQGHGG